LPPAGTDPAARCCGVVGRQGSFDHDPVTADSRTAGLRSTAGECGIPQIGDRFFESTVRGPLSAPRVDNDSARRKALDGACATAELSICSSRRERLQVTPEMRAPARAVWSSQSRLFTQASAVTWSDVGTSLVGQDAQADRRRASENPPL